MTFWDAFFLLALFLVALRFTMESAIKSALGTSRPDNSALSDVIECAVKSALEDTDVSIYARAEGE